MADLELLFVQHRDRLVRAATIATGDPEAAADAVQDAFVQAHLRWRRVSRYDDPVAWIRRSVLHRAANERRRRGRRDRAMGRLETSASMATHDPSDRTADRLALVEAAGVLSERQREVIALFYGADCSIADTALALEISEGTVKSTLSDARTKLADALGVTDGPAR